jgi:hypothetical protein
MHERSKLIEARHFLDRMHAEHGSPAAFALELSAFLGAARSVLQYARKEAGQKKGGLQWYDHAIMANPLFGFFKDLRDNSIHEMPVKPLKKMKTVVAGVLNIGDDDDEMLIPYAHNTIVHQYEFKDRPGEEVTDLSRQYLIALEGFVEDGIAMHWITG